MPTPFLPRIYYLHPRIPGPSSELEPHLARIASMGFDHVLIPAPAWLPVGDDADTLSDRRLGHLAQQCARSGLKLLVDFDPGVLGEHRGFAEAHADWFSAGGADDLPDPRRPIRPAPERAPRYDRPEALQGMLAFWRERMHAWLDAGVTGFRCRGLAGPPPSFWSTLTSEGRSHRAEARFLAWTPGCTPEQLDALAGVGFDATFSSAAWWDFRARWIAEEQERLCRIGPPIAFPDSPDEPVIARLAASEDPELRRLVYLRALGLAAAIGNGILVPMGFEAGLSTGAPGSEPPFDLSEEVARANALVADNADFHGGPLRFLSGGAGATVLLRQPPAKQDEALLVVTNSSVMHACAVNQRQLLERGAGFVPYRRLWPRTDECSGSMPLSLTGALELEAGGMQLFAARRIEPIISPPPRGRQAATAAARAPRIAIEAVSPTVDGGRFAVKRIIGDSINVEADVFTDGHDKLAVALLWRGADDPMWHEIRMHHTVNDRWCAQLPLTRIGRVLFAVEAWRDEFATYRDELEKKTTAGLDVSLELEEGRLMIEAAAGHAEANSLPAAAALKALGKQLKPVKSRDREMAAQRDAERIAALLSEPTLEAMREADARPFAVRSEPPMKIEVERPAARFSSWYELFPRSQSGDPKRHGTFADVIGRLPAIRAMGFDTLYFPPIHPIGRKHRKGRNNSLTPTPEDPGSPYAIGSEEGGHDALHPELGTLQDFLRLRDEAARHGMELALDFAIQCSPDHPWLKEHPDWFDWRPDGSIRYAENPPKKYQDIVNVDFYAEGAVPGLWIALRDVVLFWAKQGVRVFRVDNPHTKPLPFWEWMIGDVRGRYPDTIFLSEAFTRPKMMYRLAKVGFSQSYTYFTWRESKEEFIDYLTELTQTPVREFFRPHFFVNTPDINPYFLQRSGRPGFLIRAALATTLSGLWGMYSGFELCEATPVPGKEEYLDSEKYEIRAWDWQRPGNIVAEITALNRIRAENPALQTHMGVRFLNASDGNILFFLKATEPLDSCQRFGDNVVLVAINLDPFAAHEASLELPLWEFGLPDDGALDAEDLLSGHRFTWHGRMQHVRLDPLANPYAIWRVRNWGA